MLLAFTVDRVNDNYQQKQKLYEALRNYYFEAKEDSDSSKNIYENRINQSIERVVAVLDSNQVSLFELDNVEKFYQVRNYVISLEYIGQNPNLSFDKEIQVHISKTLATNNRLNRNIERLENLRYSTQFVTKGTMAKEVKLTFIMILEEIKANLKTIDRDFEAYQDLLRKKKLIK